MNVRLSTVKRPQRSLLGALALLTSLLACDKSKDPEPSKPAPSSAPQPAPLDVGSLGQAKPAPERVVAIGDLHGDYDATRRALRLAGAIDASDKWAGGKLVVVQTGDQIDRGDDDRKILDLFDRLKAEAVAAGGDVIALVGNHEVMNATFDFRYVTPGAMSSFRERSSRPEVAEVIARLDPAEQGRAAAFAPGGTYATMMARRPVVARVGDDIFVHGGVLPKHVRAGLDRINDGARSWLLGQGKPPAALSAEDGPLWTRMYSAAPGKEECQMLVEALSLLKAKRMIMGHTVQKPGISPTCDGKGWRIDVGMAKAFGGPIQVLEIAGGEAKPLAEK